LAVEEDSLADREAEAGDSRPVGAAAGWEAVAVVCRLEAAADGRAVEEEEGRVELRVFPQACRRVRGRALRRRAIFHMRSLVDIISIIGSEMGG
jgi:hypothetical protein